MGHLRASRAAKWTLASLLLILVLGGCAAEEPLGDRPVAEAEHAAEGHGNDAAHAEGLVELTPAKRSAVDIATAEARRRHLSPQLETTGEVGYDEDRLAHVSPRIPGRVIRVAASLGDEVTEGLPLVVIDSVELGEAKARYLAARSRESVTRESYERELALYEDRISSQKEMLEAKTAFVEAAAERESAEETLHLYGLSQAQVRGLGPDNPGASTLAVRAPIAGRVVAKHVTMGELVTPSDSLFTIADLGHVWIWIDVFERDLASVHEGDHVEVRVDSFPDRVFAGEVTYLSSEVAAQTRTLRARIDVSNPDRLLRPGMFAAVHLTDPHATGGAESLVVPAAAVVRSGKGQIVFTPAGERRFRVQPISTGRREAEWVEVLSGLEAGDVVVTAGAFYLKSELAREELGGGHSH